MNRVDPKSDWTEVGKTSNATFYRVSARVLAVIPFPDSRDDETTARESIVFQNVHWQQVGHRGAVVVFMDPVIEQTRGARRVYAEETGQTLSTCYALVSEGLFAQAASAVFTGLSKPGVPTRIFASFEDALPWIDEMNQAAAGG